MSASIRFGVMFAAVSSIAALGADPLNVTVTCNGQFVKNLPIFVIDSLKQRVPTTSPTTDLQGEFEILNPADFTPPYFMSYQAKSGSRCPAGLIYEDSPTEGHVRLYSEPNNLPCSCAKLLDLPEES